MTSCCICFGEFLDWEVNNPRYCCSAKFCKTCAEKTQSCPRCQHQDPRPKDEVVHLQTLTFKCFTFEGYLCLEWSKDGMLDHPDEPAEVWYDKSGNIQSEQYYKDGKLNRTDGPAYIHYYESGKIKEESYWNDGKLDRTDGPAKIYYYESGNIQSEQYYKDGKLDRADGPAKIYYYESGNIQSEQYYKDGKLDHTDGPLL